MAIDFIHGNMGSGSVARQLLKSKGDIDVLQPFEEIGRDGEPTGRSLVTRNVRTFDKEKKAWIYKPKNFVTNAPSTLRREEWIHWDSSIQGYSRPFLRIVSDLRGAGLTYNLPNAMAKTMLHFQTIADAGTATLSMDGMRRSEQDRPIRDVGMIPIPIVHSDFGFPLREILISRNGGEGLDTTMLECAVQRCSEEWEKLTLGTLGTYSYGGGTIYGITNYPSRIATSMTNPTSSGWTPQTTFDEIIDMVDTLSQNEFNGPYGMYFSKNWLKFMYRDYSGAYKGDNLMRKLNTEVPDLAFMRKIDFLTGFQVLIFQMSKSTVRVINGMDLRTIQWEEAGGMDFQFKVMGIMVPHFRTNSNGNCGVNHGVAA